MLKRVPRWLGPRPRGLSREAVIEPGDEQQGDWSREKLVKMDTAFCSAMLRAHGDLATDKCRPSAANGSRRRRRAAG